MVSAATIATVAAMAYPIVESLIHEVNSAKAANLRSDLNALLARNNLKINDIRSQLEKKGVSYNQLMNSLNTASRAGKAWKIKQQADKEMGDATQKANYQINQLTNQNEMLASQMGKQAEKLESRGILRSVIGEIIR